MRNKLISGLAGAAFSFAASGSAFAQAPPPAPVYNWTGWYVGVNAGASFGRAKTDFNGSPITLTGPSSAGPVVTSPIPGVGGSNTEYPDGFMGGGQIGYNWQYSPLIVLGLEADFQGALEKDSNTLTNPITASVPITLNGMFEGFSPVAATAVTDYTTKIEWFGTARVRIGYVWGNGNVMSYLTGGLAYGRVDIGGTSTISGHAGDTPFSVSQAFSHNDVNIGWVVGYGTEGLIDFWGARNWTWKVEGLWMDLGTIDTTGVITAASVQSSFFFPPTGGRSTRTPVSPTASFAPG